MEKFKKKIKKKMWVWVVALLHVVVTLVIGAALVFEHARGALDLHDRNTYILAAQYAMDRVRAWWKPGSVSP